MIPTRSPGQLSSRATSSRARVITLDTHAWVWWIARDKRISRRAQKAIERSIRVFVPSVCLREVALLISAGRLRFDRPVEEWLEQACRQPRVELAPLTPRIVVES